MAWLRSRDVVQKLIISVGSGPTLILNLPMFKRVLNMKQLALILMLGLVAGCSTVKSYDGPAMPEEKVARIEGSTYFWGIAAQTMGLCEVDGKRLVNKDDDSETPQYAVEVLPEEHAITICYSRSNASRTVRSPFDCRINSKVEPGIPIKKHTLKPK